MLAWRRVAGDCYSRVDDADTTLQTVVEGSLTTATGENLGLDNQIITTYHSGSAIASGQRIGILTNGLGNGLGLFSSVGDLTLGDTDAVLY